MKVDVITVEEVTIGKWSWFSRWIDVAIFDYECRPWLVQMRVSRTNAKSFRAVSITGRSYKQTTSLQIGNLTQMTHNAGNNAPLVRHAEADRNALFGRRNDGLAGKR